MPTQELARHPDPYPQGDAFGLDFVMDTHNSLWQRKALLGRGDVYVILLVKSLESYPRYHPE